MCCRQHCDDHAFLLHPSDCIKGFLTLSSGSQAVMNHSHALSSNAFTVSQEEYSRGPNGLSYLSRPRKKGPMRPSMELRHRQLDLSLLQVSLLQHPALSLILSLASTSVLGFALCRIGHNRLSCFRSGKGCPMLACIALRHHQPDPSGSRLEDFPTWLSFAKRPSADMPCLQRCISPIL